MNRGTIFRIFKVFCNLVPIALIWLSAFFIYWGAFILHHYTRDMGIALAGPAELLTGTSKIYIPYIIAAFFTLTLIISQIKYPKYLRVIQVGTLSLMLLYASFAAIAFMTTFMCMCCDWQQW
ncbi:MAG: hypothetical protein D3906_06500 [Candidatus Electrothrix sp. AUS1_2]|nr:hypothetical protein [Candidatus Electrothrix sp. AUS1_2]